MKADEPKQEDHRKIDTGGGAYTEGDAKPGADFVGRDKITHNYIPNPAELLPLFVRVPAMPKHFVGRDEILESLLAQLTSGEALALSAEGLGGVGKTTLAIALAYHREVLRLFKDGVLWAGLGPRAGESEVMSILNRWATALGKTFPGCST